MLPALCCHRRQSGPCLGGQVKDLAGGKGVTAVVAAPDDNNRVVDTDGTVMSELCCHRRQSGPCHGGQVKDLAGGKGVRRMVFGEHHLASEEGAQQGDPLGPLIFSLLIAKLTEDLGEMRVSAVEKGETLSMLAERFGVDPALLRSAANWRKNQRQKSFLSFFVLCCQALH